MYGQVTIDGKTYIERLQIFPNENTVASGLQIQTGLRVTLPGVANFLLKGLTRDVLSSSVPITTLRFKFKLGNTDGAVWYTAGGISGTTDRVMDTLMFGNGQFPYPIIPPIFYTANSSILYEIEDVTNASTPYVIYFGFHGSYLVPTGS